MTERLPTTRVALLAGALALATLLMASGTLAPALAQEAGSTTDRKDADKAQQKKDKEFNREILYRHAIGPKVLTLGPYSISLFVQGQPLEARLRVAVQTTSELARQQLEAQKMAMNGIIYPLAVRMFEHSRPSSDQIRAFKDDSRERLIQRYPDMIEEVFIESMI